MEMQHAMDDMAALTEDVLLQIFSRVGSVKDLFKFAVTCRRWLRRFTDPAFLRGLCPGNGEGHRARLLGFFFQQTRFFRCEKMIRIRVTQQSSVCAPTFVPAPGSPLGLTDRTLTSFLATDDDTFNYAEPLAARCGHVLMRLVPRTERMIASSHLLGLCNPITGERHVLPPLELTGLHRCLTSYAIITSADSDLDGKQRPSSSSSGCSKFLQLYLTVQQKEDCNEYFYSYSAATRSWSAPTMCVDGRRFSVVGERSAVIHKGAAHWLFIDRVSSVTQDDILYKLSAEVGTARISLTKLPFGAGGSPLLCVSRDGKLSVACVFPIHVRVWTQQDDTPATWLRTVIRIPMAVPYPNYSQICQPREKWFDFNRGSMLVLYRSNGVFILDLEKKVMEKAMDCLLPLFSDKLNRTSVAYEMDLVEFFVLQLGGLCRGSTG